MEMDYLDTKPLRKKPYFFAFMMLMLLLIAGVNASYCQQAGEAFTDPDRLFPMKEDWISRPIKYADWGDGADIVLALDQHLYPALLPIIEDYAEKNALKIKMKEGTCGISAGLAMEKVVDMAAYCCPPGEADRLPGIKFHTLGIAALRLLVHPDNPIENVTLEQARGLFSGEITRWSELKTPSGESGPNLIVQPIGRLHCKARPGHWRLLLDNEELFSPTLKEVGAIPEMISAVADNPSAIGYETIWMVQRYELTGKVKSLSLDGYTPDNPDNLISNSYPLYRTFVISTWEGKNLEKSASKELVKYLIENVSKIDAKFGFIDAALLKRAGWGFMNDEMIAQPDTKKK